MRFAAKFDWLPLGLLTVCAAGALGLPLRGWLLGRVPAWVPLGAVLLLAYVLLSMLPQYYEIRADGLFLRLGVARRVLIPYGSIAEVRPETSVLSAGVFSFDRIRIVTAESRTYIVAPADQDGFLTALAGRRQA